jgi:hypothetical protein
MEVCEEVERPELPLCPVGQLQEDLVHDPVAERRLHGEAAPQERQTRPQDSSSRSRMYPSAGNRAA